MIGIWNRSFGDERVLDFDVSNWPSSSIGCSFTLELESTRNNIGGKMRSRTRNLIRLKKAQGRNDILNLTIHHSCCMDTLQLEAILNLLTYDERGWLSFTMTGINDVDNFYSSGDFSEELKYLFQGIKHVRILRFFSSTRNRGHGLELILQAIPSFMNLEELHLEGWQIDRISASTLTKSLGCHAEKSIRVLSMSSCHFIGENTFNIFCRGLNNIDRLNSLDVSYCNLDDSDIIPLIDIIKKHPGIKNLDLEKNCCRAQSSVDAISTLIRDPKCKVRSLNIGSLWTGFSEEGLMQRFVDPVPFFSALRQNSSLYDLNVSDNYLENGEIQSLSKMLLSRDSHIHSLDVGMNPFDENGAASLLQLVHDLKTLHNIKFGNSFIEYDCARLIIMQAEINYYGAFLGKSLDIPLSLWPNVFFRIQQGTKVSKLEETSKLSTEHIYRLLRASTGSYGKQLSLRIALRNTTRKYKL